MDMKLMLCAFFFAAAGVALILGLSPAGMAGSYARRRRYLRPGRNAAMSDLIRGAKTQKKENRLRALFADTGEILRMMDKTAAFNALLAAAAVLFAAGIALSLAAGNPFLAPVLGIGLALVPFYYVRLAEIQFRKLLAEELETALGVITTSYSRGANTLLAAVKENLPHLMPPVSELFAGFVFTVEQVAPSQPAALLGMKQKLDSPIFHEWVDTAVSCLDDAALKPSLQPIVNKLSDLRGVNAEMDVMMYPALYEYICMALLLAASIPLIWLLNEQWFAFLVTATSGKILLAFAGASVFVTAVMVIRHVRPLSHDPEEDL